MKPTDEEFERLWVPLAQRFGAYPSCLMRDIAWFVLELGYRREQTETQSGTDDENVSSAVTAVTSKYWP